MSRKIFLAAAALIGTAVILGAFGAHALEKVLSIDKLDSYKTGVLYQLFHGLALLALSGVDWLDEKVKKNGFRGLLVGTLVFSVSIYILSFSEVVNLGVIKSVLGPITPLGGTILIASWAYLFVKVYKDK